MSPIINILCWYLISIHKKNLRTLDISVVFNNNLLHTRTGLNWIKHSANSFLLNPSPDRPDWSTYPWRWLTRVSFCTVAAKRPLAEFTLSTGELQVNYALCVLRQLRVCPPQGENTLAIELHQPGWLKWFKFGRNSPSQPASQCNFGGPNRFSEIFRMKDRHFNAGLMKFV